VIVRPETIQIDPAGGGSAGIRWTGTVRQRLFRGSRHLYTIDVNGQPLTVDAPPDRPLPPGTRVALAAAADHTWAVRD
jgi:hypothetical protein